MCRNDRQPRRVFELLYGWGKFVCDARSTKQQARRCVTLTFFRRAPGRPPILYADLDTELRATIRAWSGARRRRTRVWGALIRINIPHDRFAMHQWTEGRIAFACLLGALRHKFASYYHEWPFPIGTIDV
jgi:hypothetical protein